MFSPDFGIGTPRGLPELIASSIFGIGFVLLGIAIARAGVLSGDADVLLAVGGPIYAFSPRSGSGPWRSLALCCWVSGSCG